MEKIFTILLFANLVVRFRPCFSGDIFPYLAISVEFVVSKEFLYFFQIPDKDLERRRCGQKIDPVTGDIYTEDIYNPDKPNKEVSHVLTWMSSQCFQISLLKTQCQ